jgi:hypothetical protein
LALALGLGLLAAFFGDGAYFAGTGFPFLAATFLIFFVF